MASSSSSSMMRQVQDSVTLPLDSRRGLKEENATIPQRFLQDESDVPRVEESWKRFCGTVKGLCKSRKRRTLFQHSNLRHAVFASGMINACQDFSRRTDNVKVRLIQKQQRTQPDERNGSSSIKIIYSLQLNKLSEIPAETRAVRQFCVAEIPIGLPVAQGVFVGTAAATSDSVAVATVVSTDDDDDDDDTMGSSFLDQNSSMSEHSSEQPPPPPLQQQQQQQQQQELNLNYVNPPVAMATRAEVDGSEDNDCNKSNCDKDHHRSGACGVQMEELESINIFLTEQEFMAKRQAIMGSCR